MKFRNLLGMLALALTVFSASATPWSSTDSFGYTGTTTSYNQRDMADATSIVSGDDNAASNVALPFSFNFFGTNYNSLWVSTNGLVGFSSSNAGSYCCSGTAPGVSNSISLGWMDWITSVTAVSSGAAGSREFILNWSGSEYGSEGGINAQMILHEASNDIEFQYANLVDTEHSMFIGITDIATTDYLEYVGTSLSQVGLLASTNHVPEPASMPLVGMALVGMVVARKRQKQA
ncbi:PEP-CTERM sorting domain-containing protein [Rhodoferax sp.]|uniref:PEP-CTERM sorting domain-containing protein n=1 Tax=Rhodoferax sp. TaxID=50421 RepID=UPI0025D7D56E|nr:PEP-CTERM sorting domain-containing protein [Rhodoferax sp.]